MHQRILPALFMLTYAYSSAGANNGQISGITDGMDTGRTASYTYDGLGRLSTAATVGSSGYPAWGLSWTYDRFGNRTAQTNTAGSVPSDSLTISATTNQVTGSGYSYDISGNMTSDYVNLFTADAASNQISSYNGVAAGYLYDGKGIRRKMPRQLPALRHHFNRLYLFWRKSSREYDNGAAVGSPSREYIYSGGTQIRKNRRRHYDLLSARPSLKSLGNEQLRQCRGTDGPSTLWRKLVRHRKRQMEVHNLRTRRRIRQRLRHGEIQLESVRSVHFT